MSPLIRFSWVVRYPAIFCHLFKVNHMLNQPELHKKVLYSPESGTFQHRAKTGKLRPAGTLNSCGYIRIFIDKKAYLAHRLAWLYMHGSFPQNDIDHINGIRHDNRIENLRDVSRVANAHNRKRANKNNSHGRLGVYKVRHRWVAQLGIKGARRYLGIFDSAVEAENAYRAAKGAHEGALDCK